MRRSDVGFQGVKRHHLLGVSLSTCDRPEANIYTSKKGGLAGILSSQEARLLIQINGQGGGEDAASCFHIEWEDDMPESVYDVILLIGSSNESWEKAAANAV